ncbi:MAG: N-acetylornithine carbamoyltransferase [Sphingomonadales bacterium]|nr:N-acetylornithine carbamoyltransferase [Sphingomonadales bacterium]
MKHFLTTADWTLEALQAILADAENLKRSPIRDDLKNKAMALLFFNPSLRTRTSFELGVQQLGGTAIALNAGQDSWPLAFDEGVPMLGDEEEHVIEAAQVLGRYVDFIGIRSFPKFKNWQEDRKDQVIKSFAKYAGVPIVNMETITHPCQELAMIKALQDRHGELKGKKFVLTWTYHPKPLNTAVANSALMAAAKFGMDVTLLCPNENYILDQRYMKKAGEYAAGFGGDITISHDIDSAYAGADAVYAKSWGAIPYFGNWDEERPIRDAHKHFIVDEEKMQKTNNATFSHCLPLRRNVKATDAVMNADYCLAIEEAENRLHVQKALLSALAKG